MSQNKKRVRQSINQYWCMLLNETVGNVCFKSAFISAILTGVLVHFVKLSNQLFNHDSLVIYSTNMDWLLSQGKWFVTPLMSYQGPVIIYYVGSIVGIAAIACTGGMICSIFGIKSKRYSCLIGAILAAFPSVATTMLYNSCDYFMLTALLAVLSAYLMIKRDVFSNFLGIVLLTLSVAAYQAYIGFTVAILVLFSVFCLLNPQIKCRAVIQTGFRFIGEIIVSLGIYYAVLQIKLQLTGQVLADYKGINNMSSNLAPGVLMQSAIQAYKDVLSFIFKDVLGTYSHSVSAVYTFVVVINLILIILLIRKRKLFHEPLRVCLIAALVIICLPLSINLVGVLSRNSSFYYITVYPFAVLFIAAPIFLEQVLQTEQKSYLVKLLSICVAFSMVVPVGAWFVKNNQAYQKIQIENQNIHLKSTALVAQIQEQEEFTTETPVVFVGETPYPFLKTQEGLGMALDSLHTHGMIINTAAEMIHSTGVLVAYIQTYIAPDMLFGNSEEFAQNHVNEIQEMPIYPNYGSIQYIDGNIVVRLGP